MRIFLIGSVRNATEAQRSALEGHVARLEVDGHMVHLPHRDTNQKATGIQICRQNRAEIEAADEVHLFYTKGSQGTHFDMGMAFALGKRLRVIKNVAYGPGKSYPRMADDWARVRTECNQ